MERFGSKKWKLTRAMVADAPTTRGVYALWENDVLICMGRADPGQSIRACLLDHLEGAQGAQSKQATHYSWEICVDPEARETELLRQAQGAPDAAGAESPASNVHDLHRPG